MCSNLPLQVRTTLRGRIYEYIWTNECEEEKKTGQNAVSIKSLTRTGSWENLTSCQRRVIYEYRRTLYCRNIDGCLATLIPGVSFFSIAS